MFNNYHNVKIVKCNLTRRIIYICVFIMKYTNIYIIIIYIVHDRLNHF